MEVKFPPLAFSELMLKRTRIAIWDIDTCIADDAWRLPYIDFTTTDLDKRYAEYHARSPADRPANVEVFRAISQVAHPVFCTARPEVMRLATATWLARKLGASEPLIIMRPDATPVPSVPLKRQMIWHLYAALRERNITKEVHAALDDREDIVEMYRTEFKFPGIVLKAHYGCAYTDPINGKKHPL